MELTPGPDGGNSSSGSGSSGNMVSYDDDDDDDDDEDRLYQRTLLDLHVNAPALALSSTQQQLLTSTTSTTTAANNQQEAQMIFSSEVEIVAALHDASIRSVVAWLANPNSEEPLPLS